LSTEFYLVGRVRRAHGIRGELVIESLTDAPDAVFAAGRRVFAGTRDGDVAPGARELHILRAQPFKGGWIVAFDGIADRTTAQAWRDRTLLVPENEIEPPAADEVFIRDLIGMHVAHVNGDDVGEVTNVFELPQGLVIEIRRPRGDLVLLPFDEHTVTSVDAARRTILVDPVEGLVD
jgi:16S rRNA processing protein RimM